MFCIVGADGFFGSYIKHHILTTHNDAQILCFNHNSTTFPSTPHIINSHLELWNENSIKKATRLISRYQDIRVIFLASVHNPDIVKKDPEKAEYINTVCYENFLKGLSGLDIKELIYASSDTVYGESLDGHIFTENDTPSPINIYGRQKLMAEEITYKYGYTAARYSYMFAPSLTAQKKHFFDEICENLKKGEEIYMLTDWVRSSLSYKSAARITTDLLLSDTHIKTINICADSPSSKYDIGLLAVGYVNAPSSLVIPKTMAEMNIFTEKRANELIMSNSLLRQSGITYPITLDF